MQMFLQGVFTDVSDVMGGRFSGMHVLLYGWSDDVWYVPRRVMRWFWKVWELFTVSEEGNNCYLVLDGNRGHLIPSNLAIAWTRLSPLGPVVSKTKSTLRRYRQSFRREISSDAAVLGLTRRAVGICPSSCA